MSCGHDSDNLGPTQRLRHTDRGNIVILCMHICLCLCVYVCVCLCLRVYVCVCLCLCVCFYVRARERMWCVTDSVTGNLSVVLYCLDTSIYHV